MRSSKYGDSFPNSIPTPQRISGQTHNPLLSLPQLPQKETRAHHFENIDWIKILVPSPRIAIFTKMLPSKGGTWQMDEWFSKENLDCLLFVENPKENNEIHQVSYYSRILYVSLRSGRLVCQLLNNPEIESLCLITTAISHTVHVCLTKFCAPWTVFFLSFAPGGLLVPWWSCWHGMPLSSLDFIRPKERIVQGQSEHRH